MSAAVLSKRQVLVAGPRLAGLAREAMPEALLEIAETDRLELLSSLHSGLELVLIDADSTDPDLMCELIGALAHRAAPPAVVLIGARLPAAPVRAIMKLERSDVLEAPVTALDLAKTAAALLSGQKPVAAPADHATHCWSVMGAVGGSGATTVAIEAASILAERVGGERRVVLVDLNLADGAAAAYLGAAANMLLGEASAAPDRIDPALLNAFSSQVTPSLDLLAAPRDPNGFTKVSPEAVCRLLEVACQVYDWVIVDLPRVRQPWTLDVLTGSDEVIVLSELTVPALLAARSLVGEVESELPDARPPRIVLNRMASRMFGPAPSRAEAEKALQRKVDGAITSDWEAAACSVNLGGAITQHRPKSKIVKDVQALVDKLCAEASRQDQTRKVA